MDLLDQVYHDADNFPQPPDDYGMVCLRSDYVEVLFFYRSDAQLRLLVWPQDESGIRVSYKYPGGCRNYLHLGYFFNTTYLCDHADSFLMKAIVDLAPTWPNQHIQDMCGQMYVPGTVAVDEGQRHLAGQVYCPNPEYAPVELYELNAPVY